MKTYQIIGEIFNHDMEGLAFTVTVFLLLKKLFQGKFFHEASITFLASNWFNFNTKKIIFHENLDSKFFKRIVIDQNINHQVLLFFEVFERYMVF